MFKITEEWLKSIGACARQIALFKALFPNGYEITEDKQQFIDDAAKFANHFDFDWLARGVLIRSDLRGEYELAVAPARAEYQRATEPAFAEYERDVASAWAEHERARVPVLVEYERARNEAWAKYGRVTAPAKEEYQRAVARAFAGAFFDQIHS